LAAHAAYALRLSVSHIPQLVIDGRRKKKNYDTYTSQNINNERKMRANICGGSLEKITLGNAFQKEAKLEK